LLQIAARNLWRRKSRSLLAILALVIGVLAIVLLISLTGGLRESYTELISGVNGIWVMEKGAQDQTLSSVDRSYEDKIEQIPGVRVVLPEVWSLVSEIDGKRAQGSSLTLGFVTALGLDPVKEKQRVGLPYGVDMKRGRMMQPGDTEVAVVGEAIADNYNKAVGSKIDLDGNKYKVIGIFSKGEITDSVVAIPIEDAQELAGIDEDTIQDFVVQLTDPEKEEQIGQIINFKWPDEFDVWTTAETSEMLDDILGIIDQLLWIISGIALAIAGVGIVNTMLIAVNERMKEFGVLRSMGWTQDDVLRLVVTESVMLGLTGGSIGVVLGYILTNTLSGFLPFGLYMSPELAISAFLFSAIAGLVGGVYPAWKASRMDPIKAIRGDA